MVPHIVTHKKEGPGDQKEKICLSGEHSAHIALSAEGRTEYLRRHRAKIAHDYEAYLETLLDVPDGVVEPRKCVCGQLDMVVVVAVTSMTTLGCC